MTFATKFVENAESAYSFVQQTVIWNGETFTNALMEKFTLSFSQLIGDDTALKIKVNEEISDNLGFGETIESFLGNIEIPLDKLAKKYNTTVDVVKNILAIKLITGWMAVTTKNGTRVLRNYYLQNIRIGAPFPFMILPLSMIRILLQPIFDQIIDDVLAGIIEYDTSLNQ